MDWLVRAFIKSSVSWLALGVVVGIAMGVHPVWTVYRTAHMHIMLLGFVTMMIFGVAYHVIPRFAAHPLHSRRAAVVHWWLANVGLALMIIGFAFRDRRLCLRVLDLANDRWPARSTKREAAADARRAAGSDQSPRAPVRSTIRVAGGFGARGPLRPARS
jgi:hypothetical protein